MRVLTLIIKTVHLKEILAGTKKVEQREIRPKSQTKYLDFDKDGNYKKEREYDVLKLCGGYRKDRAIVEIEVKKAELILMKDDETDEFITYEVNGEEFVEAIIEYTLGKVLKKTNC